MIDPAALTVQQRRVLTQARKGPVRSIDFDAQPAIDGGDRILRVPARVGELKDMGCVWSRRMVPGSGAARVAEYTLVSEPRNLSAVPESRRAPGLAQAPKEPRHSTDAPGRQTHPDEQLGLFAAPVKRGSHYDLEAA